MPYFCNEIAHVRVGNRWYEYFCTQRNPEPVEEFQKLLNGVRNPRPRLPFHKEARRVAGFSEMELRYLKTGID